MQPTDSIQLVRAWIAAARRIIVLTGAGISTESGIPDFRGPQGVWTVNPAAEQQSTLQHYLADPQVRRDAWRSRLAHPPRGRRAPIAATWRWWNWRLAASCSR